MTLTKFILIMKRSSDFYKVVNAIMNTLRQGDCVAYVSGGQGGSGIGKFDPDEDFREIRMHLLDDYSTCGELEVDEDDFGELYNDWAESEDFDSTFDFYEFYTDNGSTLQVMINPDMYASSYDLRDMISDDYDFETAEITEGMNGYPSCLRGCVLLNGGDTTIEGAYAIADLYGVELVSLRRKDGWQLWQCEGKTYQLYDYQDYMSSHDDNIVSFCSFKSYADYLRETAYDIKMENPVEAMAARAELDAMADKIENEVLGVNEFIWVNTYHLDRLTHYERETMLCDHFSYDTWNYTLALDCMVED